jgi:hypothetical protein
VLAELARQEDEAAAAPAVHHDHPHSTGGEGFVTTEGEVDEVPGDGAPAPAAEELRADG